ncbi:YhbD family protein [Clostridium thermarum]|uniref:YhbD family protein n=1 Tax=Clostridium thermarum TaxID=1716543 RepID=UPI001A9AA04F|nr:YhbD family protein [Clostridium thermarum]
MEEELISKKDLLRETGISYGQLYRWKRKNLIPEEWFIRKSVFTGQETFFPREKILERINRILNMKEGVSLDDLAQQFSAKTTELNIDKDLAISQNIVTQNIVFLYEGIYGEKESFSFDELLHMRMAEKYLLLGEISFEETKDLIITLQENYKSFKDKDYEIMLIRKFGVALALIAAVPSEVYTGQGGKLVLKATASAFIEELQSKIEQHNKNM